MYAHMYVYMYAYSEELIQQINVTSKTQNPQIDKCMRFLGLKCMVFLNQPKRSRLFLLVRVPRDIHYRTQYGISNFLFHPTPY